MYKNKFLIPNENCVDPIFSNSVILIYNHAEKRGAQGVILNSSKQVGEIDFATISAETLEMADNETQEILSQIKPTDIHTTPLFFGGPSGGGKASDVYFIHAYDEYAKKAIDDIEITKGLYFGTPISLALIHQNEKKQFRFFSGVCNWGQSQLESEIEKGFWKVLNADPKIAFNISELNKLGNKNSWAERFKPSLN